MREHNAARLRGFRPSYSRSYRDTGSGSTDFFFKLGFEAITPARPIQKNPRSKSFAREVISLRFDGMLDWVPGVCRMGTGNVKGKNPSSLSEKEHGGA